MVTNIPSPFNNPFLDLEEVAIQNLFVVRRERVALVGICGKNGRSAEKDIVIKIQRKESCFNMVQLGTRRRHEEWKVLI